MEKQGIITGIGNTITPQIDAVINDFVVGYNTILNGLRIVGNNLSAGTCQLLGYRGTIDIGLNNITDNYVYGKFEIHFDNAVEDTFSIITSNATFQAPTSITQAGTYYLPLYRKVHNNDYEAIISRYGYPYYSYVALNCDTLAPYGTIDKTATTETAEVNDNTLRVANTEYVHNQIEEEISHQEIYVDVNTIYNGNTQRIGQMKLQRKAKYVIGELQIVASSTIAAPTIQFSLPNGFKPKVAFLMAIEYKTGVNFITLDIINVPTSGNVSGNPVIRYQVGATSREMYKLTFGYETI